MIKIIITSFLMANLLVVAEEAKLDETRIVEYCTIVDAMHAAILSSKHCLSGEIHCHYLGLTSKQQPLKGYLQSRPGAWKLEFENQNGEKPKIIYMSLSSSKYAVECVMPSMGKFKMLITDENGNNAANMIIKLRDGNNRIADIVQNSMKEFDTFRKVWPSN